MNFTCDMKSQVLGLCIRHNNIMFAIKIQEKAHTNTSADIIIHFYIMFACSRTWIKQKRFVRHGNNGVRCLCLRSLLLYPANLAMIHRFVTYDFNCHNKFRFRQKYEKWINILHELRHHFKRCIIVHTHSYIHEPVHNSRFGYFHT